MAYNYDETDIANEIYNSYLENKHDWQHELLQVIGEIVIYNDDENINEIIQTYGGQYHICQLYERRYKNLNLNDENLSYNQFLAFIGLYNSIYEKINEMIVFNFDLQLLNQF